jgi:hypothetical protein
MAEATFPHPVRTAFKLLALLRRDNPGISNVDCAKQLGVSVLTISHWLNKPLYQSYENWLINATYDSQPLPEKRSRADFKGELDEFAEEMFERLKDIVETTNDSALVAKIGFDMLDRAGYAEPKRDSARSVNVVLTADLLDVLMRRAVEARGSTALIDVQAVDG